MITRQLHRCYPEIEAIMSLSVGERLLSVKIPLLQILRNRTRSPNLRKPAIPHWHRAVVLKLTEPQYIDPAESLHPAETCMKRAKAKIKTTEVNPFEWILAQEFREKIENAKLVAIFHELPMTAASLFAARVQLNKINLVYLKHNNNIMKLALTGTKYEALLSLYQSDTVTFVGDQPSVAKLLKLEKRIPGLLLLGGVVEGRFMSLDNLKQYAALPSLQTLHGQLVGILGSPAQYLSQNLDHHQDPQEAGFVHQVGPQVKTLW
ncbi:large ribosomal subunit protein uL10m-like isoform X9 [Panulirus ornatus]|uniref:large ribosomal subunit protein uL10m-like isoform X9 n=1 Tax=Panulirus ornatus TaxID=150431 RepID=UPI003A83BBD5